MATVDLAYKICSAIPAAIVLVSALFEEDSAQYIASKEAQKRSGTSVLSEVLAHPEHWKTLVGTGGTWLLYDVSYYGTNIFLPPILKSIFGPGLSVFAQSWQLFSFSTITVRVPYPLGDGRTVMV